MARISFNSLANCSDATRSALLASHSNRMTTDGVTGIVVPLTAAATFIASTDLIRNAMTSDAVVESSTTVVAEGVEVITTVAEPTAAALRNAVAASIEQTEVIAEGLSTMAEGFMERLSAESNMGKAVIIGGSILAAAAVGYGTYKAVQAVGRFMRRKSDEEIVNAIASGELSVADKPQKIDELVGTPGQLDDSLVKRGLAAKKIKEGQAIQKDAEVVISRARQAAGAE
jgi:hypothetical protein